MRGDLMQFEIGKTYHFVHSRKGSFDAKVLGQNAEWVDIELTAGEARYMADDNAVAGDQITIRKSLCSASEVPEMREDGGNG